MQLLIRIRVRIPRSPKQIVVRRMALPTSETKVRLLPCNIKVPYFYLFSASVDNNSPQKQPLLLCELLCLIVKMMPIEYIFF